MLLLFIYFCGVKLHHIEKINTDAGFCNSVPHWNSGGIQHSAGTNEPAGKQMLFIQGMLIQLPAAAHFYSGLK